MAVAQSVLERNIIHAGKTFIRADEDNDRAFMIKSGKVQAYTINDNDEKIDIQRYGPGTIIGESCLMVDDPIPFSFEALEDTEVVEISRRDFEFKLKKVDKSVINIIKHMVHKMSESNARALKRALEKPDYDENVLAMVDGLTAKLPAELRHDYQRALLPHLDGLIKDLKYVREKHKNLKTV